MSVSEDWALRALAHERHEQECDRAIALGNYCANLSPLGELVLRRLIDLAAQQADARLFDLPEELAALTRAGAEWPALRQELIRLGKIVVAGNQLHVPFVARGLR